MCIACFAFAIASFFAVYPNARDVDQTRLTEFAALVAPFVADEAAAARLAERLAHYAQTEAVRAENPGWRGYVPLLRPNERALRERARRAAAVAFGHLRDGLVSHANDAGARQEDGQRLLDELARFYAALGAYGGDPANRRMLRAFAFGGWPLLSISAIFTGQLISEYPELCGADSALLGGHLGPAVIVAGGGAGAVLMYRASTKRGIRWLMNLGTPAADRASGANRAEINFWAELTQLWTADPALPSLTSRTPVELLTQFEIPLRDACATWLTEPAEKPRSAVPVAM